MSAKNLIEGDYDGGPISNQLLYELMFEDMTEQDQKENLGKPLFWNEGRWLYPDGTVKHENDMPK